MKGDLCKGRNPAPLVQKLKIALSCWQRNLSPNRKSASDEDIDYDPEEDMCDTEDTLEDIQLEKQTIVENKET